MGICFPVARLANGGLFMNRWFVPLVLFVGPTLVTASGGPTNEGRQTYEQYCAACHGWQGEGAADWKKPDERGEMPPPPHDETGHTWRHGNTMLFRMIGEGWRHPFNKTDRLTMPAFKDTLTDQEIQSVIMYLKTLWTEDQRRYQQSESQSTIQADSPS